MTIYAIKNMADVLLKTQSGRVIAYLSDDAAREEIDRLESDRASRGLTPRGYQVVEFMERGE